MMTPPVGLLSRRIRSCVAAAVAPDAHSALLSVGDVAAYDGLTMTAIRWSVSTVRSDPNPSSSLVRGSAADNARFFAAGQNRTGAHATALFKAALLFDVEK